MTLAERLRAHVATMQSEESLDDLGGWIARAVILLREAADAMTPRKWPPDDGREWVLGFDDDDRIWEPLRYVNGEWRWYFSEPDGEIEGAEPALWLPWPEGGAT